MADFKKLGTGKADWFTEWEILEKRKKNDDGTTQTEKWPLSSNPTVGRNANGTIRCLYDR